MESGQSEIGFLRTIVEEYSEEKSPLIRETRPPSNFSIPDIPWTIIHDLRRVEERGDKVLQILNRHDGRLTRLPSRGGRRGGCTRARMPESKFEIPI